MSFIKTPANYLMLMNKYYFNGVIVVEGKSDVSYLSSFIDSLYFTTNGYDIYKCTSEQYYYPKAEYHGGNKW